MDLKDYINNKIDTLDASGDKTAAVKFFQTHLPNLTRKQLATFKRTGLYPFEFAEAIFANDTEDSGTDAPQQPPMVAGVPMQASPQGFQSSPEDQNGEFEDENLDGTSVPVMPEEYLPPVQIPGTLPNAPTRVIQGRRTRDIRVVDPRFRTQAVEGPAMMPPPVDIEEITAAVTENLIASGWTPPAPVPQQRVTPQVPVSQAGIRLRRPTPARFNTASGMPPQRQWNESPQAFATRMANGG